MLQKMLLRKAVAEQDIAYVGYASVTSSSTDIDLSGIGLQANDIVVVLACIHGTAGSVDLPSGYTQLYTLTGTYRYKASYKRMGSTPDSSVTVKSVAASGAGMAMAFRGVNTTTAIDKTTTSASASVDPPSITTATNNAMVIPAVFGGGSTSAPSAGPSGYTDFVSIRNATSTYNECVAMSSKIRVTAGAENPSAFTATLSGKIALSMALRKA